MKRTPFKKRPPKKKEGKGLFSDYVPEKKGIVAAYVSEKKGLIPKKESKDEEWQRIKKEIRPFFIENDLYYICELQLSKCIGNALPLQFAHSKKRFDIAKEEPERTRELKEVVRACTVCHNYIETLPDTEDLTGHERMYRIVVDTINLREKRLGRWHKVT